MSNLNETLWDLDKRLKIIAWPSRSWGYLPGTLSLCTATDTAPILNLVKPDIVRNIVAHHESVALIVTWVGWSLGRVIQTMVQGLYGIVCFSLLSGPPRAYAPGLHSVLAVVSGPQRPLEAWTTSGQVVGF